MYSITIICCRVALKKVPLATLYTGCAKSHLTLSKIIHAKTMKAGKSG